ncbi:MAG TPA: hypothetical protein VGP89_03750 [Candidatus Angelobacter sp.]|nr:hypothetical protein [Candidatus Angelobacter sp.]
MSRKKVTKVRERQSEPLAAQATILSSRPSFKGTRLIIPIEFTCGIHGKTATTRQLFPAPV